MNYGIHSETETIRQLLLKHPREAFIDQKRIDEQWEFLHYTDVPDFNRAIEEYDAFADLLTPSVDKIVTLPRDEALSLDSIYVRDAVVMTDRGAILCRMGKRARRDEPESIDRFLKSENIPILGSIQGEGLLEGGDVVFLNQKTVAVGQGYRSNVEGIRQLRNLTAGFIDEIIPVPLPHWQGPEDVLHLMSFLSPIDNNVVLVYSPLMPVPFRQWLMNSGFQLLELPEEEYATMGCNVLALEPGRCIMLSGNPRTRQCLEDAGVEVLEYHGDEISKKGAGGPTCLTRPLWRSPR